MLLNNQKYSHNDDFSLHIDVLYFRASETYKLGMIIAYYLGKLFLNLKSWSAEKI